MAVSFGSDNHSGVHPEILAAISAANSGHAAAYGTDELTRDLNRKIEEIFKADVETFLVFNGTAANVLSLQCLTQKHGATLVTDCSHFWNDEAGAAEAITGTKLIPLPNINGKFSIESLKSYSFRGGDQHFSQVQAISLTQPTELGTCYSLAELIEISEWAKSKNIYVHIDGARFANSLVTLNITPSEFIKSVKVDALSWGGTKNGLLGAELVLFFNSELSQQCKYLRKQMCQLPSKTRFLSAQFLAYFKDDLYLKIAQNSLKHSQELSKLLENEGLTSNYLIESNAVFVNLPQSIIKALREKFFFYVWNEKTFECRLMTSWDTNSEMISSFVKTYLSLR